MSAITQHTPDTEEMRELVEIMRTLPVDYRATLHGAALGLKMAVDLDGRDDAETKESA